MINIILIYLTIGIIVGLFITYLEYIAYKECCKFLSLNEKLFKFSLDNPYFLKHIINNIIISMIFWPILVILGIIDWYKINEI